MSEPAAATTKRMKLRYDGVCRGCGAEIPAGVLAVYDKVAKNVTCVACTDETPMAPVPVSPVVPEPVLVEEPEVVVGVAGASADRKSVV